MKELRIFIFYEDPLVVNTNDPDMGLVEKLDNQIGVLNGEVMISKLKRHQDWGNRIHNIHLGCKIAICEQNVNVPFNTELGIDEQQPQIDTKDTKNRFLWEACKISDKFSDVKNLDSHFLYNEFDGTFYKFFQN